MMSAEEACRRVILELRTSPNGRLRQSVVAAVRMSPAALDAASVERLINDLIEEGMVKSSRTEHGEVLSVEDSRGYESYRAAQSREMSDLWKAVKKAEERDY